MCKKNRNNKIALPHPSGTVVLRQAGQFLYITPPVKRLDRWFFTILHNRFHDPKRGARIVPLADPLIVQVKRHGKPALRCPAGLKQLICELLERHGLRVEIVGDPPHLTAPSMETLAVMNRLDYRLLDFVRQYDRGLLWYERQGKVCVYRLIAQIALAWPNKSMAVVVTHVEEARRLVRRLRKFLPGVSLVTSRDRRDRPRQRVVVVTPGYLRRGDIAVERRRICIAVNPAELFSQKFGNGDDVLKGLWKARLYGLASTDEKFSPRLRDLMTAFFSSHYVVIPRHGHREVNIKVVFSKIRGGPPLRDAKDEAIIKRLGVHQHHLRNRRVCNLAAALASNATAWLKAGYPEVAACVGEKAGRVGILVDCVPHGLALARMLKTSFIVGPLFQTEGLTGDDLARVENGRQGCSGVRNLVVVTGIGMKYARRLDVLIRADGGIDLPNIPLVKHSTPYDDRCEMLVIDFRDEHHPLLRKWSRLRRTSYDEAGWSVVGLEKSNLERFLDTRPEVI